MHKNLQGRVLGDPCTEVVVTLIWQPGAVSRSPHSHRFILGLLLANVVPPTPQSLDNLGKNSRSKWDTEEDQGLVYKVG